MTSRRQWLFALVAAYGSLGASYRTTNFVVEAPNAQVAQQVGQYAEKYRKEKAIEWLGQEMPPWGQPCPLKVTIKPGHSGGGFTTFAFDRGSILEQEMNVEGPYDRILASVLPHEITHTVFAYHFRRPLPRWADEGGSVLSEDDVERKRHDDLVRQCLAGGRAFRLRHLFELKQYPDSGHDVMTLYAQGYSLSRFLVEKNGRKNFLTFVDQGTRQGWDNAVQSFYGMKRLEDLEAEWLDWMRGAHRASPELLAKNAKTQPAQTARPTTQASESQNPPVIRAQAPSDNESPWPLAPGPKGNGSSTRQGWSGPDGHVPPPTVQLLPPQMDSGFGPAHSQPPVQFQPR